MKYECKDCTDECTIETKSAKTPEIPCIWDKYEPVTWNAVKESEPKLLSEVIQTEGVDKFEGFEVPEEVYDAEITSMIVSEDSYLCENISFEFCKHTTCSKCVCNRLTPKEIRERFAQYLANYYKAKEVHPVQQAVSDVNVIGKSVDNLAKLPKLTVDVFNREDCPKWAKYAVVGIDGKAYYYQNKPTPKWYTDDFGVQFISKFDASDWQHSLIKRPTKKTIRPWNDDEMKQQVGKVIRKKSTKSLFLTFMWCASSGCLFILGGEISAKELLEEYEQLDGSPCGVEVVE